MRWEKKPQSYANHARLVPPFHFGVLGLVAINLLWSLWGVISAFSPAALQNLVIALVLTGLAWYVRIFPLKVQDRIIRLETELRLRALLPAELAGRVGELSVGQLIALRFAGDAELPGLVAQVLDGKLAGRDAIKKRISDWRADYLRV